MSFSPLECKAEIRRIAFENGFSEVGIADAGKVDESVHKHRLNWLADGCAAGMSFLNRHIPLSADVASVLPSAKSIIVLAAAYFSTDNLPGFSKYALGSDYHTVLRRRATPILKFLEEQGFDARICIDSAPLAERYWAQKAGLGTIGKNSLLINRDLGSFFFLTFVLTSAPLVADEPSFGDPCGNCTRCIDACPAKAIRADRSVDARRCLSYLTIEHKGDFPAGTDLKGRIFGCDTCQNVCPKNAACPTTPIPEFRRRESYLQLSAEIISLLTQQQFSAIFRDSPIKRARLEGLLRNLKIVNHN